MSRSAVLLAAALTLSSFSSVGAAQPATKVTDNAAASQARLRSELGRIAAASKGKVGVVAIHLGTGETVHFNGDSAFPLASVIKLPIAAYAFALADQGKLSLTEVHPIARDDMIEPGILNEHFRHPGAAISTLNAIELSVTVSDNGATDFILARVGGAPVVNAWLTAKGMATINVGNSSLKQLFAGSAPVAGAEGAALRSASPRAMARFLAELHKGRLLSRPSTASLLDIMSRTAGERIKLHLPGDVKVLHKTGTLFGEGTLSVNDVGYMIMPGGETIAIAAFITNSPESVAHAVRDNVIGHMARSIYDYFQLAR